MNASLSSDRCNRFSAKFSFASEPIRTRYGVDIVEDTFAAAFADHAGVVPEPLYFRARQRTTARPKVFQDNPNFALLRSMLEVSGGNTFRDGCHSTSAMTPQPIYTG